ncbi:MAG: hypothetical protein VKK04_26680 [Synechococcales bacterium]|nr:hypothetical protein [Synechococcales bacterium]
MLRKRSIRQFLSRLTQCLVAILVSGGLILGIADASPLLVAVSGAGIVT